MQDLISKSGAKVVLVAGASSGIGKAAAEQLALQGHNVFGTSRDSDRVSSEKVTGLSMELGDTASVEATVEAVIDSVGRLDAIFYAAGFYLAGAVEETTPEQVHAQMGAYLVGAHRLTKAVLPHFRAAGSGRLLYMSSSAGDSSLPYHVFYSASKAALQAYCDGLRYEVEPFGVQVAYLQAGGVKTGAKASFQRASDAINAYDIPREKAIGAFHRMQENGPVPHAVGRAVVNAIEDSQMKSVYRVDLSSKSIPFLQTLLPEFVFRSVLKKMMDL